MSRVEEIAKWIVNEVVDDGDDLEFYSQHGYIDMTGNRCEQVVVEDSDGDQYQITIELM